ncbi:concanavalin A-like lectin/glucanase domain-containing protein [Crassisporium funariophilum]|nr:concanavalin A-like lectin/glucanase domain-containing protein [Crassisporium funariophilum]
MLVLRMLPLYLILLLVDLSSSTRTLVPRAIHGLHQSALRRTHSLAHDLRVAFRGVLVPRANPSDVQHVVYCKPGKQTTFPGPNSGPGGGTGNTTTTSTGRTTGRPTSSTPPGSKPTATVPASSPWKLTDAHQGNTFYNGWDFFTSPDPTHGIVDFVDENTARSTGLLEINSAGNAIMRVETTPSVPGNRKSIRITTQSQFNGGLVIMDSLHMPTGCGIWPAFWTNGPNWPIGGEIDIMEGVHDYTNNQATIHTDVGCTLASTSANTLAISGSVIGGTDCAALTTGNQGCGIRSSTSNSFGAGFNSNNGGIYAMKWDTTGIAVYFFPRGSEPADITAEVPQPDKWGPAQARWPATSCDPFKFFSDHHAIFDTTLCGDWAGAVWNAAGIPGQEQSCAQRTGFSTCEAFVRASGSSMNEAYWEVISLKIYQLQN